MNVPKTGRLLPALALAALFGMPAAHAAGPAATLSTATLRPVPTLASLKAALPAPIVKLGDAMLEEYDAGNPADRTTLLRGGDVAQKVKGSDSAKKQS